ncbi:MAG: ABC transporter ATP-binding protein [Planctomycetaceae bacterium]
MTESSSPVVQKLVSANAFTQPRLLIALLLSVGGSVLLSVSILCSAAIVSLVANSGTSGAFGLMPLADAMAEVPAARGISVIIQSIPLLHNSPTALTTLMLTIIVCIAGRWMLRAAACSAVTANSLSVVQRLRQHIHRKAIRLEPADLSREQSQATDRLFREATRSLESSATRWGHRWLLSGPDITIALLTALCIHWRLSIEVIVPVILGWYAIGMERQRSSNSSGLLAEQSERGLQRLSEGLRKTRIVTGFAMEQLEQQQFEKNLAIYKDRCMQFHRQESRGRLICRFLTGLLVLLPTWLLCRFLLNVGLSALPAVIAVSMCATVVFQALTRLRPARAEAEDARVRADEINSYIGRVPLVGQTVGAQFFEPMTRSLTFDQVTLTTSQHPRLLNNLDLRINAGETVALLSLNPLPAYALASMIPRFVDPDVGQVLIDGRDVRQATLESLRAEVIYVGGTDPVFNASIFENVTCGQADITRHQVQEACKLVHADSFIRTLPKGYDTLVGEHGVALDPGQTFRLSLARAIVRKPAILIIEEPPVMLDSESKTLLDDAYQRVTLGRTVIFLPSRLSTVKKCDRIILIHNGKVAADDAHEQLVRHHELYRHWEYTRFNNFREEAEPAVAHY